MKNLRYLIEYILLLPVIGVLDLLPMSAASMLVRGLAGMWFFCDFRRRKVAITNVITSGICSDRTEAVRIARASYRHFALVVLESLKSGGLLENDGNREHIKVTVPPEIEAILRDPTQGIILATGHLGSWEIAAQALSLRKPVAGVTRGMNNPYVDRLMQKRKPRHQFYLLPKYDQAHTNRFLEVLRNGHILALMIDQHAARRGVPADFFGSPASSHAAIALLHLVSNTPLCFGYCKRTAGHSYELYATGPFKFKRTGDKAKDIRDILEALNRELEKAIRDAPEQYLWAHRRWR